MIRRPPRSTLSSSSAASDVYKRQVKGSAYQRFCPSSTPTPGQGYASDGAVTVNQACGHGSICAVTALTEVPALDGETLETVESPRAFNGSLGRPQTPFPPGAGPQFYMGAHMPTDANGDSYGCIYVFKPAPGYRIFKVLKGTNQRVVLPDVAASPELGGAPSYNHQALAFTQSYILLPEMPLQQPTEFNWTAIQDSWNSTGHFYWRVIDKVTGAAVARYRMPAFYSWHNINAWENRTHLTVDITWAADQRALDGFAKHKFTLYPGKFVRITMPNPALPSAVTEGEASLSDLTREDDHTLQIPEFGCVNPAQMWARRTRFLWGSALDSRQPRGNTTYYNTIFQLNTDTGAVKRWHPTPGDSTGAPLFVPRRINQSPELSDGVVVVLTVGGETGKPAVVLLDGESHQEVLRIKLPIDGMTGSGLHSHWSELPTSV
eukprot:TRINITY_DN7162_c0_g1_i6.p1 TRINITY_DN7162_c0_g1~~TRINITY_DN7162_c0_g1_i6.p1  ORF type:complete len:434 (+),score=82.78 TRINITY_DN7162_c0_g1_i6:92-1393(+)